MLLKRLLQVYSIIYWATMAFTDIALQIWNLVSLLYISALMTNLTLQHRQSLQNLE